jgi:CheY-like chemotaxis protein
VRVLRLLIVEDSPAYLYLIRQAFEHQNNEEFRWELSVAIDGEQALDILFAEERGREPLPDLILLDWNLPRTSGNQVLQGIKTHKKICGLPVLVFSTSDAETDIHDAYHAHANGYITKPGSLDKLNDVARTVSQLWTSVLQVPKIAR